MSQWKNTDDAANSVSWAARSIGAGSGKTAQAANNTALFGNTTANSFVLGQIVGQFGVDPVETKVSGKIAHAGYVLRREGTGGRAGRVHYEVLVAMGSLTGDAGDDVTLPDS